MKSKKIVPLYICVVVSVLLSGFAAFSKCFNLDSASFPLGVLTLLVTVLIGWNIYSLIDFNQRKAEIDEISKKLGVAIDEASQAASAAYWGMGYMFYESKQYAGAATSLVVLVKWLLTDACSNVSEGNFAYVAQILRYSHEAISKDSAKYKYDDNNRRILRTHIFEIRSHKDYHLIKNDFDDTFNNILDMIKE